MFQIRDFILSGNIKEAEKVINSAYPELLDDDHLLHFYLQIQHLIELIRRKQIEQAVVFAQEDIVEKGDYPECLPDLERVMGLLAYPEPEKSPFSDLLKQNFRLKVWSRVNEGTVISYNLYHLLYDIKVGTAKVVIIKIYNHFEAIRSIAREPTTSRLDKLMRYVLWSQQVLQEKNITYTKMTNYVDVEFKGID